MSDREKELEQQIEKGVRLIFVREIRSRDKQRIYEAIREFLFLIQRQGGRPACPKCQNYCKIAAENDGVPSLLEVMQKYSDEELIQCNACAALGFIANFYDRGAETVQRHGAVPVVVKAMSSFQSCSALQVNGCAFLYSLVSNEERAMAVAMVGGVEAVVMAIKTQPHNQTIQLFGSAFLLCVANIQSLTPLVLKAGGLSAAAVVYESSIGGRPDIHDAALKALKLLIGC